MPFAVEDICFWNTLLSLQLRWGAVVFAVQSQFQQWSTASEEHETGRSAESAVIVGRLMKPGFSLKLKGFKGFESDCQGMRCAVKSLMLQLAKIGYPETHTPLPLGNRMQDQAKIVWC